MFAKGNNRNKTIPKSSLSDSTKNTIGKVVGRRLKEESTMKLSKTQKDMLKKLEDKNSVLTEGDVNYIKNTINGTYSEDHGRREHPLNQYQSKLLDLVSDDGYRLTEEQTKKGLDWLRKKRIYDDTFGHRERNIYDNFKEFRLVGFHDKGNSYYRQYVPVYSVISNDGNSFDYNITAMGSQAAIEITG